MGTMRKAILVVDDDPADIFITEKAITKFWPSSFIEHAGDGCEAIKLINNGHQPELILLDLKMPGLGGLEVLSEIRKLEKTRYIPVVMLTSSTLGSDLKAAYDAGANSYLNKTLDFDSFTEEIKAVLHYWLDLNMSLAEAS